MPTRHDDLFGGIARFDVLYNAWRKAIRGKRRKPGAAAFTANLETNLLRLERQLQNQTWRPGRYVTIETETRITASCPLIRCGCSMRSSTDRTRRSRCTGITKATRCSPCGSGGAACRSAT